MSNASVSADGYIALWKGIPQNGTFAKDEETVGRFIDDMREEYKRQEDPAEWEIRAVRLTYLDEPPISIVIGDWITEGTK